MSSGSSAQAEPARYVLDRAGPQPRHAVDLCHRPLRFGGERGVAPAMRCQQDDGTTVAWPTDTASHARQAVGKNSALSKDAPMSHLTSIRVIDGGRSRCVI